MADLIYREAAARIIADMHGLCRGDVLDDALMAIHSLPAVDAAPVVHGRWLNKNEEGVYGPAYCSVCDFELRIDDMPYCPMCGTKMDGERRKNDE